jgi:hypothetical protein
MEPVGVSVTICLRIPPCFGPAGAVVAGAGAVVFGAGAVVAGAGAVVAGAGAVVAGAGAVVVGAGVSLEQAPTRPDNSTTVSRHTRKNLIPSLLVFTFSLPLIRFNR